VNRYPIWKYVVIAVAILFGLVYTLPNFFGELPAVQVSSAKATGEFLDSRIASQGIGSSG
jgi:preprotein translocase subunit SecD